MKEPSYNDHWQPACGGTEQVMLVNGVRILYCWNPGRQQHAYLNVDNDMIMSDEDYEALKEGHRR